MNVSVCLCQCPPKPKIERNERFCFSVFVLYESYSNGFFRAIFPSLWWSNYTKSPRKYDSEQFRHSYGGVHFVWRRLMFFRQTHLFWVLPFSLPLAQKIKRARTQHTLTLHTIHIRIIKSFDFLNWIIVLISHSYHIQWTQSGVVFGMTIADYKSRCGAWIISHFSFSLSRR